MEKRNLKLLFFSSEESEIKSLDLGFKKLISFSILFIIGIFVVTSLFATLFIKIYNNYRITELRRQNLVLATQLSAIEQKMDGIKIKLKDLEKFDNDLRIIADLPKLDEDVRDVGTGGTEDYNNLALEELPVDLKNKTRNTNMNLDQFARQVDLQLNSFIEIEKQLHNNQAKVRHTPSIRPVMVGRLKSRFGNRIDPFLDVMRHHDGIDIAAEIGTPVYAPADGVVITVQNDRVGYGRHILIDHGYGVQTLYGHLSTIDVKVGQKIKRWDKIGEVGRSGKATGYHLHYEVMVNERPLDPMNYIYNW